MTKMAKFKLRVQTDSIRRRTVSPLGSLPLPDPPITEYEVAGKKRKNHESTDSIQKRNNSASSYGPDAGCFGLSPQGRAASRANRIYQTNYLSDTVEVFSLRGVDFGVFAMPVQPTGLVFDNAGNLYVSSDIAPGYSILKFAPDGKARYSRIVA